MREQELIPHLFRTEYRKIVSVLCKLFGIAHIETAEDIVSDAFLLAAETWGQKGLPENPTAWLYTVSKNKTLDLLRREKTFSRKIAPGIKHGQNHIAEIDLSEKNILDSQLQMMFAVCDPVISKQDQVCLALNILCGFGAEEIGEAFLASRESMYKKLSRAKKKLQTENIAIQLPPRHEIDKRLEAVLTVIYLFFNEGYCSASQNSVLRKELCMEAMRLCLLLLKNERTNTPQTNSLLALMCFHASRFEARTGENDELIFYAEQDETLWDQELISRGGYYLKQSQKGNSLTKYHLEAAIAFWHTKKENTLEKWENILQLYDVLVQKNPSPVAALNRTYALARVKGAKTALAEAEKLNLTENRFYFVLLGELYREIDKAKAKKHFQTALGMAKLKADRRAIGLKIKRLSSPYRDQ